MVSVLGKEEASAGTSFGQCSRKGGPLQDLTMASVLEKEATEAIIQTASYYKFTKSRLCTEIINGT